jgi:hypothetical protein
MTKVAVYSHGSPDFLIDIVADGLCRLLGRENVFYSHYLWPWQKDRYNLIFKGFETPNIIGPYDADALVVSDRTDFSFANEWMEKTGRKAVAIIDGEDEEWLHPLVETPMAYFKREMMDGRKYPSNVRPLQFAAVPESLHARPERMLPTFFMANMSDPIRQEIVATMREMDLPVVLGKLPKGEYDSLLSSSRIGVSSRGAGWDTYRYWEIPYAGALLFSQKLPLLIPGNFVDGQEAIFFTDMAEFRLKMKSLLESPDEAKKIAESGQKASNSRHLSIHRAKTVLEALA